MLKFVDPPPTDTYDCLEVGFERSHLVYMNTEMLQKNHRRYSLTNKTGLS